jgi:transposase
MSGVLDQERLSLKQVATRLCVHVTTVWRWTLYGVRGKRLRTHMVGGRRYVAVSDLEAFLEEDPERADSASRKAAAESAGRQLDALGVKPR